MKDALGDRMKQSYEDRARLTLPRRNYTLIRIDGKAFHTYTRGLIRPFDDNLIDDMNATAAYLCKNIMGAKFAYVQSDEISILITDFEDQDAQAWFDNNLQKMCSVSSSMATRAFNEARLKRFSLNFLGVDETGKVESKNNKPFKWAEFDSRVFQIASRVEVINYFIWRQKDATRNSISSAAQALYSSKELHSKSSDAMQELIFQKGINWNDYPSKYKRGRVIEKELYTKEAEPNTKNAEPSTRSRWVSVETPIFTKEKEWLSSRIPVNE